MGCTSSTPVKKPSGPSTPAKSSSRTDPYRGIVGKSMSACRFCGLPLAERDVISHAANCDQREVGCWHSWCREIVKLRDLQAHMEQCAKRQTVVCVKCGESVISSEMPSHRDSCHLVRCERCGEETLGRLSKYCAIELLETITPIAGPFATEALRTKFEPRGQKTKQSELNVNVARIQHLWRWNQSRSAVEDIVFRLVYKEMDLKKEGFAIFKAHDKPQPTTGGDAARPQVKRSRSVLQQPAAVTAADVSDHYFPALPHVAITIEHVKLLIVDLRKGKLLPFPLAWRVFNDAAQLLATLPNVQVISALSGGRLVNGRWSAGGKVTVVGDLHGQLADLLHILDENGLPSETACYVFNGDFVDRGSYGVEVLLLLFSLLVACPKYVALNRGNHECDYMNEEYGFDVEVSTKYDRNMFRLIQRCFCALPLGTLVGDNIFVVHGGIPRLKGVLLEDIRKVQRFRQIPVPEHHQAQEDELFQDLMWSDPWDRDGWRESDRGAGVQFGADVTKQFLRNNNLQLVVRSHEEYMKGYEEHHDGSLITVFSASNYDGPDSNYGAYITFVGNCAEPSYHTHQVAEDDFDLEDLDLNISLGGRQLSLNQTGMGFGMSFTAKQPPNKRRTKDEVLRLLRERIYQRRHRLLAYFAKLDRTQKGTVWKIEWVEVMRNIMNLDLPWFFLRPYICEANAVDHRINYSKFLARFYNKLMQLWLHDWETATVQTLKLHIKLSPRSAQLRQALASTSVNYNVFCSVIRTVDFTLTDAQLFQLFLFFDREYRGHINGEALLRDVDSMSPLNKVPPQWELDAVDQLQNFMIYGRSQLHSAFKTTYKDRSLTREKFLEGMKAISRGVKKQLTTAQQEAIFNFLDTTRKNVITFDQFVQAFLIVDSEYGTFELPLMSPTAPMAFGTMHYMAGEKASPHTSFSSRRNSLYGAPPGMAASPVVSIATAGTTFSPPSGNGAAAASGGARLAVST